MKSKFAMIQMESVPDPAENLKKAEKFIREAVELCAPDLVVFPETFMSEDGREVQVRNAWAQSLDGPFVTGMRKLARSTFDGRMAQVRAQIRAVLQMTEPMALP